MKVSKEKTWSGTWRLEAEREERKSISLDCDYLLPPRVPQRLAGALDQQLTRDCASFPPP